MVTFQVVVLTIITMMTLILMVVSAKTIGEVEGYSKAKKKYQSKKDQDRIKQLRKELNKLGE